MNRNLARRERTLLPKQHPCGVLRGFRLPVPTVTCGVPLLKFKARLDFSVAAGSLSFQRVGKP